MLSEKMESMLFLLTSWKVKDQDITAIYCINKNIICGHHSLALSLFWLPEKYHLSLTEEDENGDKHGPTREKGTTTTGYFRYVS